MWYYTSSFTVVLVIAILPLCSYMLYPYIPDLPFTEESRKRPVHIITASKVMPISSKTLLAN